MVKKLKKLAALAPRSSEVRNWTATATTTTTATARR